MSTSWLNEILHEHRLRPQDSRKLNEIFTYFQKVISRHPEHPVVRKAGSSAKKIAIHDKFDLDLLVLLPRDHPWSVHDFYYDMMDYFDHQHISYQQKDAAIVCHYNEYGVDVVPAKWIDDSYQNIWRARSSQRVRTSVDLQVKRIDELGVRNLFKLVKIWKNHYNLPGSSFLFENYSLRAIDAMDDYLWQRQDLGLMMLFVFEYFESNTLSIRIYDHTNSNNHLSDIWSYSDRQRIKSAAFHGVQILQDDDDYHILFG